MSTGLDQTEANNLLKASLGLATYTAPTGNINLAIMTTVGSDAAAGTEVTGGSYVRKSISTSVLGTATNGSVTNSVGAVSFTNMPLEGSPGIQSVELYDSTGTPVRKFWGSITPKIINAGDTVTVATSNLTISLA